MEVNVAERLRARSLMFSSLSLSFQYPDDEVARLLREWVPEALRSSAYILRPSHASVDYALELAGILEGGLDTTIIRQEYTRLFLAYHPRVPCPPYESVYVTGNRVLYSDEVSEVLAIMRRRGLAVSENFREPPEHVASELDLAAYLLHGAYRAALRKDYEEVDSYLADYFSLLGHLYRWVPRFCECVEKKSREELYRVAARTLRAFVSDEWRMSKGAQ